MINNGLNDLKLDLEDLEQVTGGRQISHSDPEKEREAKLKEQEGRLGTKPPVGPNKPIIA